jgi:hydroxymethylpyrimidine/phosphomethylpyrimidine kinase
MLATAETIEMVADVVVKHKIPIVVDPVWFDHLRFPVDSKFARRIVVLRRKFFPQVMVSTSGHQLLPQEAVSQLTKHLLPHTTLLTPNIPEASLILSQASSPTRDSSHAAPTGTSTETEFRSVGDLEAAARRIQALGPSWVLVKGGHIPFRGDLTVAERDEDKEVVVDVLVGPGEGNVTVVKSPWQSSSSTHGTGCTLACKWRSPGLCYYIVQAPWSTPPFPCALRIVDPVR